MTTDRSEFQIHKVSFRKQNMLTRLSTYESPDYVNNVMENILFVPNKYLYAYNNPPCWKYGSIDVDGVNFSSHVQNNGMTE